jgi:hypothetical protein
MAADATHEAASRQEPAEGRAARGCDTLRAHDTAKSTPHGGADLPCCIRRDSCALIGTRRAACTGARVVKATHAEVNHLHEGHMRTDMGAHALTAAPPHAD